MRGLLMEAAKSGEIEKLRPLLGTGDDMTQLSLAGIDGDPIEYLKGLAGDEDGQEILAILEEVLSAGYVHLDVGTPEELYVWPYFFAIPIDKLTGPQRVELFKIVTAGDYEEMKAYGSYIFYRVGITPTAAWRFSWRANSSGARRRLRCRSVGRQRAPRRNAPAVPCPA